MYTDPRKWAEVRRRVQVNGESIRGFAQAEGLSRNTIRKMLRQDRPSQYTRPAAETQITGYEKLIDAILLGDDLHPRLLRQVGNFPVL